MPEIEDAGLDIDFDAADTGNGTGNGISPEADRELAAIQLAASRAPAVPGNGIAEPAAVDGQAVPAKTVELLGKQFKIADKVGLMPLLKFSAYADMEVQDPRAMGAMYAMIKDCIDPADWRAFEDWAVDSKAEADDLFTVIQKVMEAVAGRPTRQSGPSSPGPRGTSGNSTASSSSRRGRAPRR